MGIYNLHVLSHFASCLSRKYCDLSIYCQPLVHIFSEASTVYIFRLSKLNDTKERLGKSVNMRAMSLLGKAEENCNELMKKKSIIENDKLKILETIAELDRKKNEAVTKAYEQVRYYM